LSDSAAPHSDLILNYSDFIDESRIVSDRDGFYEDGICPHCRVTAPVVRHLDECGVPGLPQLVWAQSCQCGWWQIERHGILGPDLGIDAEDHEWAHIVRFYRRGILRVFRPQDLELPTLALRKALSQKPDLVYYIHHRKMEELVADVMRDFIGNCEVEICGRSGDGGIDLILVISDSPMAIQVKRRTRASAVEGVQEVRHFLAAMQIRGITKGLFVTTADHFSAQASIVAEVAVNRNLVTAFELMDRHRFFSLINATKSCADEATWQVHLEHDPWAV